MHNYRIYTISTTDLRTNITDTKAYFRAKIAYNTFKIACELHGYKINNVMYAEDDTLIIAQAGGKPYYHLIQLSEHILLHPYDACPEL